MQNKVMDIVKFVACLFVVAIHINPMGIYGSDVCWLSICACRWAVPFFFATSGYLFFSRGKAYGDYAKRLLIMYAGWLFIMSYFVWQVFFTPTGKGLPMFILNLFVGNTFDPSWYLSASLLAVGLVYLLRKMNNHILLSIGALLYIPCLLSSVYYPIAQTIGLAPMIDSILHYFNPNNSFCSAFIYIVLGKIIAEIPQPIISQKTRQYWILLSLAIVLMASECVLMLDSSRWIQDSMLALPLMSYSLVMLVVSYGTIELPISPSVCHVLRNCSVIIYLSHYAFIHLVSSFHHSSDWKAYGFVVICSLTLACVMQWLNKYIKFLKYLY